MNILRLVTESIACSRGCVCVWVCGLLFLVLSHSSHGSVVIKLRDFPPHLLRTPCTHLRAHTLPPFLTSPFILASCHFYQSSRVSDETQVSPFHHLLELLESGDLENGGCNNWEQSSVWISCRFLSHPLVILACPRPDLSPCAAQSCLFSQSWPESRYYREKCGHLN